MRLVRHSAVVLVAVAGAALAQAQQPPGSRPNQPPPTSQLPAEIVPDRLAAAVAEDALGAAVPEQHDALRVGRDEGVRRVLDHQRLDR